MNELMSKSKKERERASERRQPVMQKERQRKPDKRNTIKEKNDKQKPKEKEKEHNIE